MANQESTTTTLIPLRNNVLEGQTKPGVSARALYAFLGLNPTVYARWTKKNIVQNGFAIEHTDWESAIHDVEYSVNQGLGGNPAKDYILSIDFAKRLAMMARSAKGEEARTYFLECERRANEPTTRGDLLVQMAEAYRAQEKRLIDIEAAQQSQALQLIEQQASVIAHLQLIVQANEKADHALQQQQWITLREYVFTNALTHQLPPARASEFGKWLAGYCLEKNIPVRRIPIADRQYETENGYHVGTIETTLPGWLKRREGQRTLSVLPSKECLNHEG